MARARTLAALLVACFGSASAVAAANLEYADFFGHYVGNALSKTEDARYLGFEMRDLDVTIGPTDGGFRIAWTTLRRKGPDQPKEYVKRTSRELDFVPAAAPSVFRATESADPLDGGDVSWARIDGRSLIVYVMNVSREGLYEMQIYVRTLGDKDLRLLFTRVRDGERVRKVSGKLRRVGG